MSYIHSDIEQQVRDIVTANFRKSPFDIRARLKPSVDLIVEMLRSFDASQRATSLASPAIALWCQAMQNGYVGWPIERVQTRDESGNVDVAIARLHLPDGSRSEDIELARLTMSPTGQLTRQLQPFNPDSNSIILAWQESWHEWIETRDHTTGRRLAIDEITRATMASMLRAEHVMSKASDGGAGAASQDAGKSKSDSGGVWRNAAWFSKATAEGLYPDLLRKAFTDGRIESRKLPNNNLRQYEVGNVSNAYPEYEERLRKTILADS